MAGSLLIKNVWKSESEIHRLFLERFKQNGLVCDPVQGEVRVASSTDVSNSFTVRQREGDWWEARISISEVSRYLKNFGDTTYEGRDIRVDTEAYVRDEVSLAGCLLGLIPALLLLIVGWAEGRFLVGVFLAVGTGAVVHWVVRGILRLIVATNTRERDNLLRRVDDVLTALANELSLKESTVEL